MLVYCLDMLDELGLDGDEIVNAKMNCNAFSTGLFSFYPDPPWTQKVPPIDIYAWRDERMFSKAAGRANVSSISGRT